ncbi:MAG: ThiF family adenylyltransferase [Alphaproteobacteria bacterium]|nr:ThiF family adenylyltransferase [Reyranella sp.]MBL6853360.1 ThiF family adenylyltransferase [Alphaproteobacteria bacterium]MBL6940108.1 ThiF family adenylyltransferase [Alphaproteobacteria bacterium]MBL7100195.1 ThiF family adenylyltransferase [Alphaproteobacteria bacterium]
MSPKLFSRNPDLQRLRDDGYFVQIVDDDKFLVMREVPYVNDRREVKLGTLVTALELAGDITKKPVPTHVVMFDGDYPCDANGKVMNLGGPGDRREVAPGLFVRHSFSQKPDGGYADYYAKMTTYHAMLAAPARVVDPEIKPRQFAAPADSDPESIFEYPDTASGRTGTAALAALFKSEIIALIGLGGTGAYILDKVAKTPVREIRLFDADEFLNHNAFRAPGAASLEELRLAPLKVDYFKAIYSRMHRGITAHPVMQGPKHVHLLDGVTFAFIAMDDGPEKEAVINKLEAIGASFIDVGMGLSLDELSLGGILRVTASTPAHREVVRRHVSFAEKGEGGVYESNIQVADLNSLNADFAVIKWKKMRGYYRDLEKELHSTYTTDGNFIVNRDRDRG